MKMFIAYGKRVRMSTAVKAYILLESGETFSKVADKYAKGHHLFLNAMLRFVETDIAHKMNSPKYQQQLFELLGTEYKILQNQYLEMLDETQGDMFHVKYHYYTSHNTKSRSMTKEVKAYTKQRAQAIAQKVLGGDAVMMETKESG